MSRDDVTPSRRTRFAFLLTMVFLAAIFPVAYPAPFGSPYSTPRVILTAVSVGALSLTSIGHKSASIPVPPWPGTAIVALIVASLTWAHDSSRGFKAVSLLLLLTTGAVIAVWLLGLNRFLAAFALAAVVPIVHGISVLTAKAAATMVYPDPAMTPVLANVNELARLAVMAGVATLAAPSTANRRILLLPVALMEFTLAFVSGSNQARLSLVVSGATLMLLSAWKRGPRLRPALPLFLAAGFVALAWGLWASWSTITVRLGEDSSLNLRTGLWSYLLQVISNHPFLGAGWGCAFAPTSELVMNLPGSIGFIPLQAHNTYLQLALEVGVAGALLLPTFLVTILINTYKGRALLDRAVAIGSSFVVVNLAVWSISADVISGRDAHLWVLLVAIGIGTRPVARLSRRAAPTTTRESAVIAA